MSLQIRSIAPDANFLAVLADLIREFNSPTSSGNDFSQLQVLLPNLKLVPDLAQALCKRAQGAVLLPVMNTLSGMAEPWVRQQDALPDSHRHLILHALLRGKNWFDEALLWEVVGELSGVFDTLTEHEVSLPDSEEALLHRLEQAFELKASVPLAFEAKLINTLWRAEAQGRPSNVTARILATHQWASQLKTPLVIVAESEETTLLEPLAALASERVPVLLIRPDRRLSDCALANVLAAAWPCNQNVGSLHERAKDISEEMASAALERLQLISAESLEGLGQVVADQILRWIRAGKQHIAIIALDRLAARRARALLERENVLVQDETGWKMSTTRVAAVVDTWLEVLASDAYHRTLIDLLRAPMLFAGQDSEQRGIGCEAVENLIRESGVSSGLDRLYAEAQHFPAALPVLRCLREARVSMGLVQMASIAEWLRRLHKSLTRLGAIEYFERDGAGRKWLEWYETRLAELAEETTEFTFSGWRTWLNRQMDATLFRDESIDSPVIMTHLAATRLRRFDAAILVGADTEHLGMPAQPVWLAHAGVRRELGLPGLTQTRQLLCEDLAGLVLASGQTVVSWQSRNREEEMLPSAEIAVLTTLLTEALGYSPVVHHISRPTCVAEGIDPRVVAPTVPSARLPTRLSASAMQTLMDCPYRYFARYVLRLNEVEELSEGMEKRGFGEQLHAILHQFHQRFPHLQGVPEAELLETLESLTDDAFSDAVGRNFQDHAWRLRWRSRIADYVVWQKTREAAGWSWLAGEQVLERDQALAGGHALRLHGRIDRMDQRTGTDADEIGLLDYKSRKIGALRAQAKNPEDVQLAFYALLKGESVSEAAYVALDDDLIGVAELERLDERVGALQMCMINTFEAILDGHPLPAHGSSSACAYCEMRGLCRREWQS